MAMVTLLLTLSACRTGRSGRPAAGAATADPAEGESANCMGQFSKKLQDMTADLQKMKDQDYKVEIKGNGPSGITIYTRTIPWAVRQYLTASHVETVPEVQQANHRGYYQIRPRPNPGCGLDYQVRFIAP
jgi:hypothetical protein